MQGIELNVDGSLTDRWTAGLALTYNDATWDKYYNTTFASWTGPVPPATDPPRLRRQHAGQEPGGVLR